jgi:hypothetical protein
VVFLSIHLHKLGREVFANPVEYRPKAVDGISVENLATILGHKDQMYVERKSTVSSVSNIT